MARKNRPFTILGIPIKATVVTVVFVIILAAAIDPFELISPLKEITKETITDSPSLRDTENAHIEATPEMISKAIIELENKKRQAHEVIEENDLNARYYYIIELHNGGDLEATDVLIKPDIITIISQTGIETTMPRSAIKDIRRYRLPDATAD